MISTFQFLDALRETGRYDCLKELTDKDFNDVTAKYFSKSSERLQRHPEEEEDEEELKITMLFFFLFFVDHCYKFCILS